MWKSDTREESNHLEGTDADIRLQELIQQEENRLSQLLEAKRLLDIIETLPPYPDAQFTNVLQSFTSDAQHNQEIVLKFFSRLLGYSSTDLAAIILHSQNENGSHQEIWVKIREYLRQVQQAAEKYANLADFESNSNFGPSSLEHVYSRAYLISRTRYSATVDIALEQHDKADLQPFKDPDRLFSETFGRADSKDERHTISPYPISFNDHSGSHARSNGFHKVQQSSSFSNASTLSTATAVAGNDTLRDGQNNVAEERGLRKPEIEILDRGRNAAGKTLFNHKLFSMSVQNLSVKADIVQDQSSQRFAKRYARLQPQLKDFQEASDELESAFIRSVEQQTPFFLRQRDIFEDGMPPIPRAGWPTRSVDCFVHLKALNHLPKSCAPVPGRSHFSIELCLGGDIFKNAPCAGDVDNGCILDQDVRIPVDEKILEAASKASKDGSPGPLLTVTCFDCGLFEETDVVGTVSFRVADILALPKGWNEFPCCLSDLDDNDVIGHDLEKTTLSLSFCTDEGTLDSQRTLPTLASILSTAEGPLTLQRAGGPSRNAPRTDEEVEESQTSDDEDDSSKKNKIFYWKEWLEKFLDSLWVTVVILILLLLDISMFLASTITNDTNPSDESGLSSKTGSGPEDIITFIVTGCSMVDLTLRQITQGVRFWQGKLNLIYCAVIWLSMAVVLVKLIAAQSSSLSAADGTTGVLRVLSRVALALRLLRIIVQMRKARQLSGKVRTRLRVLISQNRRRYTKHGFDLDITYITDRVLATSAPSFGATSSYRNDIHVVARFLSFMHYGRFFVWNLCDTFDSSDGLIGQYHPNMIFQQVQRVPTEDHCAPLLVDLFRFCEDAAKWLLQHPKNVVVAHCKGGKGRTGVFISSLLVWTGHRRSALDALELFTFRRTKNYDPELGLDSSLSHGMYVKKCNQTVEGPSQIRYVHYIEALLYTGINPIKMHKMLLRSVRFTVGPAMNKKPWDMSFTIKCLRAPIYDSKSVTNATFRVGGRAENNYDIATNVVVWGDVCIDFYKYKTASISSAKKNVCFITFNTAFYTGKEEIFFPKNKMDKICKDRTNKLCDENFAVTLNFTNMDHCQDHHHLRHEIRLHDIFKRHGKKVEFSRGEIMLNPNSQEEFAFLIVKGSVEGVIEELISENGSVAEHPLGRCIPDVDKKEGSPLSSVRCPNLCLLGPGAVLNSSPFLSSSALTMEYRARTEVEAYQIKKNKVRKAAMKRWTLLQNVFKGVAREPGRRRQKRASTINTQTSEQPNEPIVNFEIEGIEGQNLAAFYRSLSTNLAVRLTRVQAESWRIANLKAFNDKQTVKISADQDENEQLLKFCRRKFGLIMTERINATIRCYYRGEKVSASKWNRMRVLILRNSVVLDPGFYSPRVSMGSSMFYCHQILGVVPSSKGKEGSESCITLLLLENMGTSQLMKVKKEWVKTEHELKFVDEADYKQVYAMLSNLAKKGATARLRERERLFDHPTLNALLDRVTVHKLKKGDEMEGSALDSLFLVEEGEVKLVSRLTGEIMRIVSEGSVFGEANFALQITPVNYDVRATEKTTVFEISGQHVRDMVEGDPKLCAHLFFVLCQILHNEVQLGFEDTFAGTWSLHHSFEAQFARRNSHLPTATHALTPQNSVRSE